MGSTIGTLRVAVIDRDGAFVKTLANRLDAAGWQHRVLGGVIPVDELVAMKLNALVIDMSVLPPEEAWPFLERVAGMLPGLGVIVCTSESTVAQRVRGLRLGADDWIAKPSHPEEVMARIEAVVRRRRRATEPERGPVVVGELEIRGDQYQAFVARRSADLTRREFELLQALAEAQGSVIERGEIYRRVWGYEMAHGDRSVDVFIRKLRIKLEKLSPGWAYIHTHFGIGYRFDPEPLDGSAAEAPIGRDPAPAGIEADIEPALEPADT
jgi:DNA-binding response OmpR family regulator